MTSITPRLLLLSPAVKKALVLTCGVHDVVDQVCEPGRGLVRQQVGEEIPGGRAKTTQSAWSQSSSRNTTRLPATGKQTQPERLSEEEGSSWS